MPDDDYDGLNGLGPDHKRLAAERFRRIWQLVEDIARAPGKSRKELAAQFALSERQVQADLNVKHDRPSRRRGRGHRPGVKEPPSKLGHAWTEALGLNRSA